MRTCARALAFIALISKTYTVQLVEGALNKAYDWMEESISDDINQRQLAAVLICREIALRTPTFFYQQSSRFFERIFHIIRDAKSEILREEATAALRAALLVASQRETKQSHKTQMYSVSEGERET